MIKIIECGYGGDGDDDGDEKSIPCFAVNIEANVSRMFPRRSKVLVCL